MDRPGSAHEEQSCASAVGPGKDGVPGNAVLSASDEDRNSRKSGARQHREIALAIRAHICRSVTSGKCTGVGLHSRCNQMKTLLSICTPLFLFLLVANAQDAPQGFTADLTRYYFASPQAEKAARPEFETALKKMESYKGHIRSGSQLLSLFRRYEDVLRLYYKHEAYVRLRCAQNRKDPDCDDRGKLEAELTSRTAFLTPEIIGIPAQRVAAFVHEASGLQAYQFEIEDIRRDAA